MSIRDIPFQTVQRARKAIEDVTGMNVSSATEAELYTISKFVRVAAFNDSDAMMDARRFNVEYERFVVNAT